MLKIDKDKGFKQPMKKEYSQYEKMVTPFLFVARTGGYMPFSSYKNLYFYTITMCWHSSKAGWLDVVMFLWEWTSLTYKDATIFTQTNLPETRDGVYFLIWNGIMSNAEYRMQKFLVFLHKLTCSEYKENDFREAWDEFIKAMKKFKK